VGSCVRKTVRDKLRVIKVVKVHNMAYDGVKQEVLGYWRINTKLLKI